MNLFSITLSFISTSLVIMYAADGSEDIGHRFGEKLSQVVESATHYSTLASRISTSVVVETKNLNRTAIQEDIDNLINLFRERLSIAKDMRKHAETAAQDGKMSNKLDESYEYFSAEGNYSLHDEAPGFPFAVNLSASAVQTPKDVYEKTFEVLNSIEWTKKLDTKFIENFNNKTIKAWQYIGLSNGVFRSYPGSTWLKGKEALEYFDVRQRSWYIEGASSPKDMVIIIDLSGSVIGNRLLIIKSAVIQLLDTLQENDFVNIIYFNKNAHYLKKCWKNLVQATERNKKILKAAVKSDSLKGRNVANVDTGFTLAFQILRNSRQEKNSSNCTQTIAFFTDGVEGDTVAEDVFNTYNNEKKVRIFTYLVGRENGSPFAAVKWIACKNKGYFYRIETLSDVRENIVKYIIVLSRSRKPIPRWTPLYLDAQGLGMVSSLVVPIFGKEKKFLGVLGSDVLLDEILSKFPEPHLGPGGYPFSITNNGLVFFHPLLKQEKKAALKRPANVYLSEVLHHFDDKTRSSQLAKKMIDRETKKPTFDFKGSNHVLAKYNDLFRVVERKLEYSYDKITSTSFSVGVATTDYGSKIIRPKIQNDAETLRKAIEELHKRNFNISIGENWPYCPPKRIEDWEDLKTNLTDTNELKKCLSISEELINLVLFDIIMLGNHSEPIWNPKEPNSSEIKAVFFGTTSGLTFSKSVGSENFSTSIKQEYFERAADSWKKKTIIFSAASQNEVHASKAVVGKGKQNDDVLWGVAGIYMTSSYFKTLLLEEHEMCNEGKNISYLLDENGYVIFSCKEDEVRKFFGTVDGTVMEGLIKNKIYKKYNFTNVQATCKRGCDESSSSIRLLDPLFSVVNYAKWWTQTIALSLIQYGLYALLTGTNQVKAEGNEETFPCSKNIDLYFRDNQTNGTDSFNGRCSGTYEWYPVNGTNLLLVVTSSGNNESCKNYTKRMNVAEVVDCEGSCDLVDQYRVPVQDLSKFGSCSPEDEESEECSSSKLLIPSVVLIVILQLLLLLEKE